MAPPSQGARAVPPDPRSRLVGARAPVVCVRECEVPVQTSAQATAFSRAQAPVVRVFEMPTPSPVLKNEGLFVVALT